MNNEITEALLSLLAEKQAAIAALKITLDEVKNNYLLARVENESLKIALEQLERKHR
jgi:uncharacterized protein YdaL